MQSRKDTNVQVGWYIWLRKKSVFLRERKREISLRFLLGEASLEMMVKLRKWFKYQRIFILEKMFCYNRVKRGVTSSVAEWPAQGEDIQFWDGHEAMDQNLCSLSLQALWLKCLEESMGCQQWRKTPVALFVSSLFQPCETSRFKAACICVGSESNQSVLEKLL